MEVIPIENSEKLQKNSEEAKDKEIVKNTKLDAKDKDGFAVPTNIVFKKPRSPENKNETDKDITPEKSMNEAKKEFPLKEPTWGGPPDSSLPYSLTVLKDGVVVKTIDLSEKSRLTLGRNDDCDVLIEHPSCSRYHAVLQYCTVEKEKRKKGFYLYDMGSTHGTYLNKEKVKAKVYNRIRVGYQIKFGGSTRLYVVEGPADDQEDEIDLDVLREKKRQYEQYKLEQKKSRKDSSKTDGLSTKQSDEIDGGVIIKNDTDNGVSWGFREDAQDEGINLKDLFERKQNFEVKDPKKTLNGFFEREGLEFEYEMSEKGSGKSTTHVAIVRLPFDTEDGEEVLAEGSATNKKDAVLAAATEACRLIQAYDMMMNRTREDVRKIRQRELEANDFYDSDEDSFLDRTGNIEKKRLQRKKRAGKEEKPSVDTHDSLKVKLKEKQQELDGVEAKLHRSKKAKELLEKGDGDSLDSYMSSMKDQLDKSTEMKLKRKKIELTKEVQQLESLVEKTRPALPALKIALNQTKEILPVIKAKPSTPKPAQMNKEKEKTVADTAPTVIEASEEKNTKENQNKEETQQPPKKKPKKVYGAPTKPNYKPDKDFVDWAPPEGQTGDGRTALNDKLGY